MVLQAALVKIQRPGTQIHLEAFLVQLDQTLAQIAAFVELKEHIAKLSV